MEAHGYFKADRWDITNSIYTFETGSIIEFFSVDQPDKVRGPRRHRLFINEANNISLETFEQLEIRTREFIYLDWNPVSEFWFYQSVLGRIEDLDHIILTFEDNEALDAREKKAIESRKDRKNWWQVFGLGQLGEIEGKIYKDWKIIDEISHHARLERYGLDFGYTNDPTAIVAVYYYDGGYILDEICFQTQMSNKQIADTLKNITPALVIADSAEPKSVDDIRIQGINIVGALKGPDSVRNGIQLVQDARISVTKRSVNIIKEYRNYLWQVDNNGKVLNVPEHEYSHAMDAVRYALSSILKKPLIITPPSSQSPVLPYYPEMGF